MENQKKLLGDYIKEITTKVGIKQCIPCKARQARMNQFDMNIRSKINKALGKSS